MDLQKIAQEAVKVAASQAGTVNFNFNDIHHNENVFLGTDGKVDANKNEDNAPKTVDYRRLPLFVTDMVKLATLVRDLSVCEGTADVCRAVVKLCDGRLTQKYKEKDFVKALLPFLNFQTSESALYQALNKIV